MQPIMIVVHILVSLAIIALVMLQQGKGANMGAAFGSGASSTLFGSRGPASFFLKLTSMLAIAFFATALTMGYWVAQEAKSANKIQMNSMPIQTSLLNTSKTPV